MKVAIVHDWLTGMRGGEKALEALCELFPTADIYTLFHVKGSVSAPIENRKITTSFLQCFPFLRSHYRYYLPLFPTAMKKMVIKNVDLVISSSHCVAKGITIQGNIEHICYCYTPMRYLWAIKDDYFRKDQKIKNYLFSLFSPYLKTWDLLSSRRVNHFIGISHHISKRIKIYYHRNADVIYPPVDTRNFYISPTTKDYYLVVSALVPYKKIDLAISAFNQLGSPLIIVGQGPEEKRLRKIAHKNISFLGWQPHHKLSRLLAECRAFVFPAHEDFGIAPIEAMASGRPVIAYAKGGALETLTPETAVFFSQQQEDHLINAVQTFERDQGFFDPKKIRNQALKFDTEIFKSEFKQYIHQKCGSDMVL